MSKATQSLGYYSKIAGSTAKDIAKWSCNQAKKMWDTDDKDEWEEETDEDRNGFLREAGSEFYKVGKVLAKDFVDVVIRGK